MQPWRWAKSHVEITVHTHCHGIASRCQHQPKQGRGTAQMVQKNPACRLWLQKHSPAVPAVLPGTDRQTGGFPVHLEKVLGSQTKPRDVVCRRARKSFTCTLYRCRPHVCFCACRCSSPIYIYHHLYIYTHTYITFGLKNNWLFADNFTWR